MAGVVLKGVNKVFPNGFHAVHDQDLEIRDGEFMVLVGPSGCAKSTTLNMIAGLEDITQGEIWIGDRLVNDLAPKDRNIAMVFQSYALYPHMTVAQNMAFGLKLRKYSKEEIDRRVHEAAEILELGDLLDRKPKALSGGQRQRVAVGRAIVRKPAVFLFDEPLSNLDAKLRVHMRVELKQLHHKLGTTIIYVTHDQVEAMTMGDRICVLKDGRIQQVDTPLALYHEPVNKFVAGFIGSPAMNLFEADVVESGHGLAMEVPKGGTLALPEDKAAKLSGLAGKQAWLGLRPEHVSVDSNGEANGNGSGEGFQSRVAVVEMMGNEVFAYFALGREEFVARLEADARVRAGDTRRFVFDMARCHVFDHESGRNLTL